MKKRYLFEAFVADTVASKTDEALFDALAQAVASYGYEKILFSVFYEPQLPDFTHRLGLCQRNMSGWDEFYAQKNYAAIDPVGKRLRSGAEIFAVDDLPSLMVLSQAQEHYLQALADFGVHQAIAVPLGNGNAAIGLATATRRGSTDPHLDMLTAICNQTYHRFKRLHGGKSVAYASDQRLTTTEREVLSFVAAGKTDQDIAMAMGISAKTVDTHLRHIFRKLDVANRLTAVLRGIHHGYLTLL